VLVVVLLLLLLVVVVVYMYDFSWMWQLIMLVRNTLSWGLLLQWWASSWEYCS
jgi:hypothetical protein